MKPVANPVTETLSPVALKVLPAELPQVIEVHTATEPQILAIPLAQNDKNDPLRLKHGGHSYKLLKRNKSRDGNYFIKFEFGRKQYFKGLDTNVLSVAKARAKIYIDRVRAQKWEDVERLKARQAVASLADVEPLYRKFALIGEATIENNLWAMGKVLKTTLGLADWKNVRLTELNPMLVVKFQNAMVDHYCAEADNEPEQQRQARELALRSSKSIINQARSLFNKDKSLVSQYEKAGLNIPSCVEGFRTCKVLGKIAKPEYLAPPDEIVEKAFTEIEKLKDTDRNAYIAFWHAAGAGLRRSEIQRCRWEYWVERDGMVWISGGFGKDGKRIEVPVQHRAVEALKSFCQAEGRIMGDELGLEFAKRLNFWMKMQGWNTEKKMHELRAYVGSLIYRHSPQAAMKFMRHKSIRITEQFYVRYGSVAKIPDVL